MNLRISLIISICLISCLQAKSQSFNKISAGLRPLHIYDLPEYRFDNSLSRDLKGLNGGNSNIDLGVDLFAEYMFTPLLGFQLGYRTAGITGANEIEYYEGNFQSVRLSFITNWSNLNPYRKKSKWIFYSKLGTGLGDFSANQFLISDDSPDDSYADSFWEGHLGLGVIYRLNSYLRIELESQYNTVYNDGFDGFNGADGSDSYLSSGIGLVYTFGEKNKRALYGVNYFDEDYLQDRTVPEQENKKVNKESYVIDTTRVVALEERLRDTKKRLEETLARLEALEDTSKSQIEPSELVNQKTTIVYFESNSTQLSREAKRVLMNSFGRQSGNGQKLMLTGYTDRYGEDNYNKELKMKRAEAVKAFLMELGLSAENITVNSGERNDLDTDNQFLNRRVEVKTR